MEILGDIAPTSLNEIKAFLGVVMLMGIVKLSKIFRLLLYEQEVLSARCCESLSSS